MSNDIEFLRKKYDLSPEKVARLEKAIEEMNKMLEGDCPECGIGDMVNRKGKFGEFRGCTNYPRCKYTEKAFKTSSVINISEIFNKR